MTVSIPMQTYTAAKEMLVKESAAVTDEERALLHNVDSGRFLHFTGNSAAANFDAEAQKARARQAENWRRQRLGLPLDASEEQCIQQEERRERLGLPLDASEEQCVEAEAATSFSLPGFVLIFVIACVWYRCTPVKCSAVKPKASQVEVQSLLPFVKAGSHEHGP